MDQLTQDNHLISIKSPLAKDDLLLISFEGGEYLSRLFEYELKVLSSDLAIKPEKLVGEQVVVTIHNDIGRKFSGYVSHFSFGEVKYNNLREYTLTIVPWLWFLTKTRNQRIFQEMTTKDIVTRIFKDYGFTDFDFKASAGFKREYCVQYDESDFEFVSRLLEEDGITYFFKQQSDKHKMIIVDKKNAYEDCDEKEVTYSKGNQPGTQITHWEHAYEFRTGEWTLNDYDFKEPRKKHLVSSATKNKFSNVKKYEQYQYAALYDTGSGKKITDYRMDAEEAHIDTVTGKSDCSSFYAGGKFKLSKHDAKDEKKDYIISGIFHRAYDNNYFTGSDGNAGYINQFECIPSDVHYRPPLVHPKPVMNGPQTAVVTGPSGEEIYIDKYGRIKVQFIWDREGKNDESTTCYIRVIQSWAGDKWGTSFIPRIGQEVIVNFLDGNPDRPIVTGAVYNADNMPPYSSKTQSGIKTHSTKGGSASNYNELRFEDLKGSEEIYLQAEKDFNEKIKDNHTRTIDKGDETIKVSKGNRKLSVKNKIETDATDILVTGKKSIELKVGGSSIKLTPSGIVIKSTKVDVKGSAMVTIKGGITKIN